MEWIDATKELPREGANRDVRFFFTQPKLIPDQARDGRMSLDKVGLSNDIEAPGSSLRRRRNLVQ